MCLELHFKRKLECIVHSRDTWQATMARDFNAGFTRREWLGASILAGGAVFLGCESLRSALIARRLDNFQSKSPAEDEFSGGKQVGIAEFIGEPRVPMDTLLGAELDGRQYTDLSTLKADNPITPTEKFYIRTRASKLLDATKPWTILAGPGAKQTEVTMQEILRETVPQGIHLMECAGNTRDSQFGMISVAQWDGVPISKLSQWMPIAGPAAPILISGFDTYSAASSTSVPGASWIFSWADLRSSNAFLATKMNGQPLTPDHGAPVRLIVPGWYGCASIKWVNAISVAEEDAMATSQMQEYAFRTHQTGVPKRASEFKPAKPDPAAMPIRVEKWLVKNQIKYRVIGIHWGGPQPVRSLQIRFNPEEEFVPVGSVQEVSTDSWGFWTHTWAPRKPDNYVIRLRVGDPSVQTRRLDMGFYARTVRIIEV